MSEYMIQGETLTAIADAIRAKTGNSGAIQPGDMASAIAGIAGGSVGTCEVTISIDSAAIGISPYSAYILFTAENGTTSQYRGSTEPQTFSVACGGGFAAIMPINDNTVCDVTVNGVVSTRPAICRKTPEGLLFSVPRTASTASIKLSVAEAAE